MPVAPDVLPDVLRHLAWRVRDLAACCRVCRLWHAVATPLLYERIWLRNQTRLVRVFATLAQTPSLAAFVRILEVRVFPFGMPAEALEALEAHIVQALQSMTHLRELRWTRTGSLSDRVLLHMFDATHHLQTLELTGDSRTWSPRLLAERIPRSVTTLSFLLPDATVVRHLPDIVAQLEGRLASLQLLCMHSSVVTDDILRTLAPLAPRLQRLALIGCKHVHGPGIEALATVRHLCLEAVGLSPSALGRVVPQHVQSLVLTLPRHDVPSFLDEVSAVLASRDALQHLTLYACGGRAAIVDAHAPHMTDACLRRLGATPLRTLRLYGLGLSLAQLNALSYARIAHTLRDLVVHLYEGITDTLFGSIARFAHLVSVHILSDTSSDATLTDEDAQQLVSQAGEHLQQVGFRNRVMRVCVTKEGRALTTWDAHSETFPDVMLVVRS